MNTLLIVDDEKSVRYSFKRMFEDDFRVLTAEDGLSALNILETSFIGIDIIFIDVKMPNMGGIELLQKIRQMTKNIPVIVMTAFGDSETAIEAMKEGAFDYLTKPLDSNQLKEVIEKALTSIRLQQEVLCYGNAEELSGNQDTIVGKSQAIVDVCKMTGQVASTELPVLISGESGVGKELVARAIYNHSNRKGQPFMAVNCAALPEGVVESELFGCEKGAFTGAEKKRVGRFEQCDRGTIFLDEIGDMSISTQSKLLRVLQDGSFQRVGSNETIRTDVRIIAASNKNLHDEVHKCKFREDLFHRLNVFSLHIPPLRERREDVPVLSGYFLSKAMKETGKQIKGFSPDAMKLLMSYIWPGNVRELENVVRRAVVISSGEILGVNDLLLYTEPDRKEFKELTDVIGNIFETTAFSKNPSNRYNAIISTVEKCLIEKALKITKGNQVQASAMLGITRVTLRKKIQEYNIQNNNNHSA
ncbi:MAG: sigma-54-dependent Fis family transcriptional regulator [Nitrospirae bacterium]|nr:sigma-54-dependent Fis family transcriptional regulator [Nitrospirota bacterium]